MRKRAWAVVVLVGVSACSDVSEPTATVDQKSQPLLQELEASAPALESDSPDTSGVKPIGTSAGVLPHTPTGTVIPSAAVSRDVQLSEMIAFFRTGPDRERFAGLVQLLEVANGYGQPGHEQRVRALPVRVERGRVESRGGRRGMVKRYVHRSGHTREVFWQLEPTDIPSAVPAPEAEILPLADDGDDLRGPRVLGDLQSMEWSEVGEDSGTEWCEHIDAEDGDLSSECASEREADEFFAYMVTSEAEMIALENDTRNDMELLCQSLAQSGNPPQDYYEYCIQVASAADPFSAAPEHFAYTERISGPFYEAESSDFLLTPRLTSAAAVDCETLVDNERATCLMAAASAMWGLAGTILGIERTADKAITWYLSKGYRIAGRAVLAYAGATATGVVFAAYGVYSFLSCLNSEP